MRSISSADRAARDARSGKLSAAERSALNQAQCYKSYAWYPIQSTALDHPAPRVVAAFEALQSRNGGWNNRAKAPQTGCRPPRLAARR